MQRIDANGILERGGHRASLRKLSKGTLTHQECSEVMRQNYIDMALLEPPLVDVECDKIRITEAGCRALPKIERGGVRPIGRFEPGNK